MAGVCFFFCFLHACNDEMMMMMMIALSFVVNLARKCREF